MKDMVMAMMQDVDTLESKESKENNGLCTRVQVVGDEMIFEVTETETETSSDPESDDEEEAVKRVAATNVLASTESEEKEVTVKWAAEAHVPASSDSDDEEEAVKWAVTAQVPASSESEEEDEAVKWAAAAHAPTSSDSEEEEEVIILGHHLPHNTTTHEYDNHVTAMTMALELSPITIRSGSQEEDMSADTT